TTTKQVNPGLRFPLLDLARILAALAVVFFHWCFLFGVEDATTRFRPWPEFAAWSKYGHLGVQLFFMISGFLVLESAYSKDLVAFAKARALRLYPAFIACCALSYALISLVPNEPRSMMTLLYNLTMLNGVIDGFRGVAPTYIDGSYWTLALEWKFYVLVALLIVVRQLARVDRILWVWMTASLAYHVSPTAWLELLCIVPWNAYFIAGATFFRARIHGWTPARCLLISIAILFAAEQASGQAAQLTTMYGVDFDGAVSITIVVTFFALFLLLTGPSYRFSAKTQRVLALAGALSYPIYLLHLRLGAATVRAFWTTGDRFFLLTAMLAALGLVACAVHQFVEKPVWRALRRPSPRAVFS
ncbi:MAG: acyltransferase family protein, partial [bacterium]